MKGIKMSDCQFYVNKEARVIICVISDTSDMLRDFIRENFQWNDLNMQYGLSFDMEERLKLPYVFKGKAVCSKEDEWDEELGKMIAFSRAKDKCYKSFFKRANLLVQTIDKRIGDMITAFNDFGVKLEDKRQELDKKIEERTQKE